MMKLLQWLFPTLYKTNSTKKEQKKDRSINFQEYIKNYVPKFVYYPPRPKKPEPPFPRKRITLRNKNKKPSFRVKDARAIKSIADRIETYIVNWDETIIKHGIRQSYIFCYQALYNIHPNEYTTPRDPNETVKDFAEALVAGAYWLTGDEAEALRLMASTADELDLWEVYKEMEAWTDEAGNNWRNPPEPEPEAEPEEKEKGKKGKAEDEQELKPEGPIPC